MIITDPVIRYWCEGTELNCCEALGYLVNNTGVRLLYVTGGDGREDYANQYYRAYITAEPGQPCRISVTSVKTTVPGAKEATVVIMTAALLAQAADTARAKRAADQGASYVHHDHHSDLPCPACGTGKSCGKFSDQMLYGG